jgi:hypothetical protein
MRFSLRTLLIAMLLAGPLCAYGWGKWQAYQAWREQQTSVVSTKISFAISGVRNSQKLPSAAEQEIWNQQRNNISWESFPESEPGR